MPSIGGAGEAVLRHQRTCPNSALDGTRPPAAGTKSGGCVRFLHCRLYAYASFFQTLAAIKAPRCPKLIFDRVHTPGHGWDVAVPAAEHVCERHRCGADG